MSAGTKAAFLKPRPRRTELVTMPADYPDPEIAGAQFRVRTMTAGERSLFDEQFTKKGKTDRARQREVRERLIVATVIDADGELIFSEEDLPQLRQVDAALVERLVEAAMRLNGISKDDVEELEGN